MGKFLRVAALFCCLGLLVLGTIALDPNGPLLSSFRGCTAGKISLPEAIEERERIARFEEASLRRLDTKKQIAEEVISRRRSLAEAMQLFRALDQEWPKFGSAEKRLHDLGISEDEWGGRGVIVTVKDVLKHRPDEAAVVVGRLEKELQELLADRTKPRPASAEESRGNVRREP